MTTSSRITRAAIQPHGVELPLDELGALATPTVVLGVAVEGPVETTVVVGLWVGAGRLVVVAAVVLVDVDVLALVVEVLRAVVADTDTEEDEAALVVPEPLVDTAAIVVGDEGREDGSDSPVRLTGGRASFPEPHAAARETARHKPASRDHVIHRSRLALTDAPCHRRPVVRPRTVTIVRHSPAEEITRSG